MGYITIFNLQVHYYLHPFFLVSVDFESEICSQEDCYKDRSQEDTFHHVAQLQKVIDWGLVSMGFLYIEILGVVGQVMFQMSEIQLILTHIGEELDHAVPNREFHLTLPHHKTDCLILVRFPLLEKSLQFSNEFALLSVLVQIVPAQVLLEENDVENLEDHVVGVDSFVLASPVLNHQLIHNCGKGGQKNDAGNVEELFQGQNFREKFLQHYVVEELLLFLLNVEVLIGRDRGI